MKFFPRILLITTGCALVIACAATADVEQVRVEVSPYAGALVVDRDLGFTDRAAPLVGARLGISLSPRVMFEAQAGWARYEALRGATLEDRNLGIASGGFSIDLTGHSTFRPFLTLGAGFIEDLSTGAVGSVSDPFGEIGAGFKIASGSGLGLRIEARQMMIPRDGATGNTLMQNTAVSARLTLPFARKHGDVDGDGIRDNHDLCSATPNGAMVNSDGCPMDSDMDGIWDGLDVCSNTPDGAVVDGSGCPTDSDGDGVYDGVDVCMTTPAGAMVDGRGCPTDSDGDGVVDGLDNCPSSTEGAHVDAGGCEISETEFQMLDTGRLRLKGVNFLTGSANLDPSSYTSLDETGDILSRWPQLQVEIGGHTDSRGKAETNRSLSERRAQSVADYVLWRFPQISSNQVRVKGYGEEQPISTNSTTAGRSQNRRVELRVVNREELRQMNH